MCNGCAMQYILYILYIMCVSLKSVLNLFHIKQWWYSECMQFCTTSKLKAATAELKKKNYVISFIQ